MSGKTDSAKRLETQLAAASALSIDERLKVAQIAKIQDDVERAQGKATSETVLKLIIGLLAVATAAWTFVIGLPQAKLELYSTVEKLSEKRGELAVKEKELHDRNVTVRDLGSREQSLIQRVEELRHLASQAPAATPAQKAAQAEANKLAAYITFAGSIQREVMTSLEEELTKNGYVAPRSVRQLTDSMNQVRVAADLTNGLALGESVKALVEKHFVDNGCVVPALQVVVSETKAPIELSVLGSCKS